jgi:cytidine deaminase
MKSLNKLQLKDLIHAAKQGRKNAYAPYSHYQVGAAVLASDGTIHVGCNVENVSYGASTCAEQVTLYGAIASGKKKFLAIAIVASDKKLPIPCGICRQVLWELAGDLEVIVVHGRKMHHFKLSEIYPKPFQKQVGATGRSPLHLKS